MSAARCVTEQMCVNRVCVSEGDVRMVLVKLGLISRHFRPSLNSYGRARNVGRASSVEQCAERKRRVYANSEFGAQRKMLTSAVLVRKKRDEREEVWG